MTRAANRRRFAALPTTKALLDALRPRRHRATGGLWGGSAALLLACLTERRKTPTLIITADDEHAVDLAGDHASFADKPARVLPRLNVDDEGHPEATSHGRRLETLQALASEQSFTLIASIGALADPVPRARYLGRGRLSLRQGMELAQTEFLARALKAGLRRVPVVLAPGEVSSRGDVIDTFPLGSPHALRLEFFDDVLESIRRFDPASQRSLEVLGEAELAMGQASDLSGHVFEYLGSKDLLVVQHEPLRIEERRQTIHDEDAVARLHTITDTVNGLTSLDVSSLPSHDLDFKILSAGSAVGSGETDPVGRLRSIRGVKGAVMIFCRSTSERDRMAEIFAHKKVSMAREKVALEVGALTRGFRVPELELTILSNVEFAGVPQPVRLRERAAVPTKALQSFFELGPGDLVVHAAHGIAMFEGMELVERGAGAEDHLRLCFRDELRLLVPASKIHLVQKYIGAGDVSQPKLDRLGGKGFARRKLEVTEALYDLASDLLEVQSQRALRRREPYARDSLEDEFLDGFPFRDTPDQEQAWQEIRADLEGSSPMDRLLCGDVGFGKTELAMRAAFKVAITGRQVAILVPTTVLAEQHRQTFQRRFEPLGLSVAAISRYGSARDRKRVLEQCGAGQIDVLIGTHRILGKDVSFADLGLVIIDEEQRFGVRHKEHLKQLRMTVDVLTLSATPIPRTLHGAMLGVRGLSTLASPPPGRREVETKVAYWERPLVQQALNAELQREGQVFVLHNRVKSLDAVADEVRTLAPDARVATGHGQMTETEMDRTVRRFMKGEIDVLVSTTIVENGLDLPRANTILIDRAEMFGLAELHQLRGRVGRSDRQAHCYLLLDRAHPPGDDARKRLKAVEEFSQLGAGFAIAMKDLEIRGAGNLLGPQQSGHIAAVGYEMYCQLLRGAIDSAKSREAMQPENVEVDVDMQVQAYLPESIAHDPKERLELLREMDGATDVEATAALARELVDRFGELPQPVVTLLQVFLLKHLLSEHAVLGVQFTGEDRIVVRKPAGQPLGGAWLDAFADVRHVEAGKTHLVLPRTRRKGGWTGQSVLEFTLGALAGPAALTKMRAAWRKRRRAR